MQGAPRPPGRSEFTEGKTLIGFASTRSCLEADEDPTDPRGNKASNADQPPCVWDATNLGRSFFPFQGTCLGTQSTSEHHVASCSSSRAHFLPSLILRCLDRRCLTLDLGRSWLRKTLNALPRLVVSACCVRAVPSTRPRTLSWTRPYRSRSKQVDHLIY